MEGGKKVFPSKKDKQKQPRHIQVIRKLIKEENIVNLKDLFFKLRTMDLDVKNIRSLKKDFEKYLRLEYLINDDLDIIDRKEMINEILEIVRK